ncbi:MAG: RNA-guided pseudouridylation complex pseudouridine synthase subunit Cbf5 [Promethearchaeota archaeon]
MERMPLPCDQKKETIIRAEEETNPEYGCKPEQRSPLASFLNNGIINLDKPSGPTSHEIASWVKRILEVKKTGHGGTLDPNVTGILPMAIGDAARIAPALLSAGKEYVCIIRFHKYIDLSRIKASLNLFTTEIYQRPPIKSAVARNLRKRRIYYIDLLKTITSKENNRNFALFKIGCQAGTYIRKLCYDLGEVLFSGAHMVELRRTRSGFFKEDDSLFTLQDINDAMYIYKNEGDESYLRKIIKPKEIATDCMAKMIIRDTAVDAICHGADLGVNGVLNLNAGIEKGDFIAIMTQKGELVAFAIALQSAIKIASLKSGLVAKTKRVLMPRKTYPHLWK